MKPIHKNIPLLLIVIYVLIIPATANALIWLKGTSQSGELTTSVAILIPFPAVNTTITESRAHDLFGIAELAISEHDDIHEYNKLQISFSEGDSIQLPVPYGAFGLSYRLMPNGIPLLGRDESDFYWYLSVDKDSVTADITTAADYSFTMERDRLIEFITPFVPEIEAYEDLIGAGPFDFGFSLRGELSGKATVTNPTISGSIDCSIDLPEDMFTQEIPTEIPLPDHYQGTVSIEATFNWENWSFLLPFVSVNLSIVNSFEGKEYPFDPITFDLLPRGTFLLWFDRQT